METKICRSCGMPMRQPNIFRLSFGYQIAKISHFVSFLPGLVAKTISAFLPGVLLPRNF
jgi:hypothetical protein